MKFISNTLYLCVIAILLLTGHQASAQCTNPSHTTNTTIGSNLEALSVTMNGVAPYSYQWTDGSAGGAIDFNMVDTVRYSGVYSVTIFDASYCWIVVKDTVKTLPCRVKDSISYVKTNSYTYQLTGHSSYAANPGYGWYVNGALIGYGATRAITLAPGSTNLVYALMTDSATGCSRRDTINIQVPTCNMTVNLATLSASYGEVLSISTISGGTAPYIYHWSNGATTVKDTVYASGIYTCTVSDHNGCFADTTAFISGLPCYAHDSLSYINTGNNRYQVTAQVRGVTRPATSWSVTNGAGAYINSNYSYILYSVTQGQSYTVYFQLEDSASGCVLNDSIRVRIPACNLRDTIGYTYLGSNKYQFTAHTNASDPAVNWDISTGTYLTANYYNSPVIIDSLQGGVSNMIIMNVLDSFTECSRQDTIYITAPGCTLTGSIQTIGHTTYDSFFVSVNPHSASYTYSWAPGFNYVYGQAGHLLANGIYTVTVKDTSTGCTLVLHDTVTNIACNIVESISAMPTGNGGYHVALNITGVHDPNYQWFKGGVHGSPVYSQYGYNSFIDVTLPLGASSVVFVSILDSLTGCTRQDSIIIAVPSCQVTSSRIYQYNLSGHDSLVATPTPASYVFSWSANATPQYKGVVLALTNGIYSVTVTDTLAHCSTVLYDTVKNLSCTLHDSISKVLRGGTTYFFTGYSSGTAHQAYQWIINGSYASSKDTFSATLNTGSNTIILTSTDSITNCVGRDTITVTSTACNLFASIYRQNNVGWDSFYVYTYGPHGGLSYAWSANTSWPNGVFGGAQTNGIYTVTVTDSTTGCTAIAHDTVTNLTGCTLAGYISQYNNPLSDTFTVHLTPTSTHYIYSWSANTHNISGQHASALYNGLYTVTVTDSVTHCSIVLHDTVTNLTNCTLTGYISSWHYTGYDSFYVGISPFSGALRYVWSSNTMNAYAYHGIATANGIYSVTVTDTSTGCIGVFYDTVTNLTTCMLAAHVIDTTIGGAPYQKAIMTGGSGSYTYNWSDTISSNTQTMPVTHHIGTNCVTVTDNSTGCSATACDTTVAHCTLTATIASHIISGGAVLVVTPAHGSGTYYYQWAGSSYAYYGANTDTVTRSGNYCVTVTDGSGCPVALCDSVNISCTLVVHVIDTTIGGAPYQKAIVTGGSGYYNYNWSDTIANTNQTMPVTHHIGTNCVTVTDNITGCSATGCDTTVAHCTLTATIATHTITGGSTVLVVTPAHGSGTYYYQWVGSTHAYYGANTDTVTHSGNYCVTVTDGSGCPVVVCDSVHIACTLSGYVTDTSAGFLTSKLTAVTTGGVAPLTYQWQQNSATTRSITLIPVYHNEDVTVTDANGCSVVLVGTTNASCSIAGYIQDTLIGGTANLIVHLTSGTAPVTYRWNNGDSTQRIAIGTGAATYCVTATDHNGCTVALCDTITSHTTCSGHVTISSLYQGHGQYTFTANITGISHPGYSWVTTIQYGVGGVDDTFNVEMDAGVQTVYLGVYDSATHCTYTDSLRLTVPCSAFMPYIQDQIISGVQYQQVIVQGGTYPFTYHWSDSPLNSYQIDVTQHRGNNCVTVTDIYSGCTATVCESGYAGIDTICGTIFNDTNGDGVQDNGETGIANQHLLIEQTGDNVYTDANGHYTDVVPSGAYYIYFFYSGSSAFTIPVGPNPDEYDSVNVVGGGRHCGYNFGLQSTDVTISGYVYLDANNNGVMDAGETPVANEVVYIGPHPAYTNAHGLYTWTGPAGSYNVTYVPQSPYTSYTANPSSHFVNATTIGTTYSGNNFGLEIATTACNITTKVITITTITAGYPAWYDVYVSNYGTNVASGTVTFYYDPSLTFNSAYPTQASVNTSTHMITFNYSGLQPGQYDVFTPYFTASNSVVIGQRSFEMATATDNCIESNFADNTDTVHQTATGSWDPNFKSVTPTGEGLQGLIDTAQTLRYTIGFQNTGTAPAVNIVLHDSISTDLDITTLKVIAASHPGYAIQIDGRQLLCRFNQIMLPDSATNEVGSHGYLSFEIRPIAGVAAGTQITNTANIFFDYNDGVSTNSTLNTIDYPLSVADIQEHATITVVPNPFREFTTITVSGINMNAATLEVYDITGQQVSIVNPAADGVFHMDRGGLSAGVYVYHIRQAGKAIGSGKLIIEQ